MCVLCAAGPGSQTLARRANVLQLLALVEHPDALPANAALRLAIKRRNTHTAIPARRAVGDSSIAPPETGKTAFVKSGSRRSLIEVNDPC
jgi:hypothetical protein